jgi:hypothetical protein
MERRFSTISGGFDGSHSKKREPNLRPIPSAKHGIAAFVMLKINDLCVGAMSRLREQ